MAQMVEGVSTGLEERYPPRLGKQRLLALFTRLGRYWGLGKVSAWG